MTKPSRPPASGNKTMKVLPLTSKAPADQGKGGAKDGTAARNANIPGLTMKKIGTGKRPSGRDPMC